MATIEAANRAAAGASADAEAEGEDDFVPPNWTPVKFDATTARDEDGLLEREIITYSGPTQMRWNVRQARAAWDALSAEGGDDSCRKLRGDASGE